MFHFTDKDIFLLLNVRIERSSVVASVDGLATEGESAAERNNRDGKRDTRAQPHGSRADQIRNEE
jgi:hypothetical protein